MEEQNNINNITCGICLILYNKYDKKPLYITQKCKHTACKSCINQLKNYSNKCPFCRYNISQNENQAINQQLLQMIQIKGVQRNIDQIIQEILQKYKYEVYQIDEEALNYDNLLKNIKQLNRGFIDIHQFIELLMVKPYLSHLLQFLSWYQQRGQQDCAYIQRPRFLSNTYEFQAGLGQKHRLVNSNVSLEIKCEECQQHVIYNLHDFIDKRKPNISFSLQSNLLEQLKEQICGVCGEQFANIETNDIKILLNKSYYIHYDLKAEQLLDIKFSFEKDKVQIIQFPVNESLIYFSDSIEDLKYTIHYWSKKNEFQQKNQIQETLRESICELYEILENQ